MKTLHFHRRVNEPLPRGSAKYFIGMVEAMLTERSLPTPEDPAFNLVMGYTTYLTIN